jgi:hypothetical protein
MALKKRTSKILDEADMRANGMQSIDPALSLGSSLSLANFKQLIADGRAKLDDYNQTLAAADQKANGSGRRRTCRPQLFDADAVGRRGNLRQRQQRV